MTPVETRDAISDHEGGRMRIATLPVVVLCLAVTACSGSNGSTGPSSPAPAAPTLTGITISGPDALLTGTGGDYTVTASFSNQTTQGVTATWGASGTDRATVSAAGRVTGVAHGSFALTASYQGQTASKTVNIVNNYDGRWAGVVIRMTCLLNGDLGRRITQRLCPFGPNERMPMSFTVTQPAPFTEVTAEINLANIILNARGNISSDGRLLLAGDTDYQLPDPVSGRPEVVRFTVLNWNTLVSGFNLGVMSGGFDRNRTESLWQGNVYETYTFEQMRRPVTLSAH